MAGDIHFGKVSLLLPFSGPNGSTLFTDKSTYGFVATKNGDVKISNAQSRFGSSSAYFDGSGDHLSFENHPALDLSEQDYVVECDVFPQGGTDRGIFSKRTAGAVGYACEVRANGAVWLRAMVAGSYSDLKITTAPGVVPNDAWSRITLERYRSLFTIYVEGVSRATLNSAGLLDNQAVPFIIGKSAGGSDENPFNGFVENFRVTKGVVRNFYAPTGVFPERPPLISGAVKDASNAPASRLIRVLREDTGALVGSATSDAVTGAYSIGTTYDGAHTLIAYPAAGENLPALALRGVIPV